MRRFLKKKNTTLTQQGYVLDGILRFVHTLNRICECEYFTSHSTAYTTKKRLFFSSRVRTKGKKSFGKHSNTRNSVKSNILSSNFPIFTQLLVCFNWSFNYVVHWQHQFWDWRWKHCDCGCNYICNCSNDHFKFVTFFHLMWAILPVPIFVTLLHFMAPSFSRLILLFACLALVITRTATIPKKQMTRSEQEAHWTLVWVKWNVTIVPVLISILMYDTQHII